MRSGPGTPVFYITDTGDGVFEVDWSATLSGNYVIHATVGSEAVVGGPWTVTVEVNPKP